MLLEKQRSLETQLLNEQKRNRTLEHDITVLQQEVKDAVQFIEQQEERYLKARIECLKLLEEL